MITLYQFPGYWGLSSASPFCIKMETYLKLAKIPHQSVVTYDLRKTPKGKLPYIADGEHNIADTSLIIEYLKKTYGDKLDANLTPEQKAIGIAVQRMCEEHLYWILTYGRWVNDIGWKIISPVFFSKLPKWLQLFVPTLIRKKIKKACYIQGVGRFTDEERLLLGKQDIDTIIQFLGSKPYFFGDQPTSIDAVLYAFLTPLIHTPIPSPLRDYITNIPAIMEYDERMKKLLS